MNVLTQVITNSVRCLHREHSVNSGMHHWSDCKGRTTSHCCYCYFYCYT